MGKKNYLIEGVSGAGKTTVANELEKRGYHVVHGDRETMMKRVNERVAIDPTDFDATQGVSEVVDEIIGIIRNKR